VARWKITLPTWDRMQIPLPFSRVVMYFGLPMEVPAKAAGGDLEPCRIELEKALNHLCDLAEKHFAETVR
jgi:lysophospholipid acyltransferase (LPLAT)-like uncharacterized protein